MSILDWPPIKRVRRAHALEHATVHVLSRQARPLAVVGRASDWGFAILGEVETERLEGAVREALARLQAGERDLAVHPNCGTNLAVAGLLAMVSSALVARQRPWWRRLGLALSLATAAAASSQVLGARVQRHLTTSPDLQAVRLQGITRHSLGTMTLHRVQLDQP